MNDTLAVGHGQRFGDLGSELNGLLHREAATFEARRKRFALNQFHYQVIGTDVMQGTDVGMVQCRDGARFLFEAAAPFLQDLDGHRSVQACISGAEHLPHPTFSQRPLDSVRTQHGSGFDLGHADAGKQFGWGLVEELAPAFRILGEQSFHFAPKLGIGAGENGRAPLPG